MGCIVEIPPLVLVALDQRVQGGVTLTTITHIDPMLAAAFDFEEKFFYDLMVAFVTTAVQQGCPGLRVPGCQYTGDG